MDLVGEHDGSGEEGAPVVGGVHLPRHSPLLHQQVSLAATTNRYQQHQCCGPGARSGRIQNYYQDPDLFNF